MKKVKVIIIWLVVILFFVGVIPIIINESYKYGALHGGYITMWDAADVLSYYGTLLGSISTIVALAITISFTRKQIQRERFLERNREKWGKVDAVITQALNDISPLNLRATGNMDTPNAMIHNRLSSLQAYMILAKTSLNMVKSHINPVEYEQIKDYIDKMSEAIDHFCVIAHELEIEYMALQDLAIRNGGQVPPAELSYHLGRTDEIIKKIPPAHDGPYQELLDMKREVFDKIYADIEIQADRILRFWPKRGEKNAHT